MNFHLLIDGELTAGARELDVTNPATGGSAGRSPVASAEQAVRAIEAASRAFPGWAATPLEVRRDALRRIADRIDANADVLAEILVAEHGKPLRDAAREVAGAAGLFRYCAGVDLAPTPIERSATREVWAHRRPLGPVVAIMPWNQPLAIFAYKAAAALVTGNTLVAKPAPTTPLSTLKLSEAVADIVPPGVLNVIADANDLGEVLTGHPLVRKISFTGSGGTGRRVMASAVADLKRVTLELGGNDPAIVLDDVDVAAVAPALLDGAIRNNGQVCVGIKRIYAHDAVYEDLCRELARLADAVVIGPGTDPASQLGPIQNRAQFDRIVDHIAEAGQAGSIIAGGFALEGPGFFVRPTIVRDIADGARLVDEEQFGPIVPIIRFSDIDDVIRRANAGTMGLGASVWSSDAGRALALSGQLEAGTVWINKHIDIAPHLPISGAKASGVGVEFGEEGLREFTQLQVVNA